MSFNGYNVRALALATAALAVVSSPAYAQASRSFNIPAQPLGAALEAFAIQSGTQILFDKSQVEGKTSTAVVGSLAPSQALARIIAGTGMAMRQVNDSTFMVGSGPQPAAIAAANPVQGEPTAVEELIVTGENSRLSANLESFPGSVTVVGKEEVKTQLAISTDVGQLLESKIPGLGVSSRSASDANQTLRGRGLSYYVDGVPVSNPLREGSREMRTIATSALAGVEVIRGASALYGNGGNGGSVNYLTKRATGPDGISGSTRLSMGGSLTHAADSWDPVVEQDLQLVHGPFDLIFAGSLEKTSGYFDADGDRIVSDPTGNGGISDSRIANVFAKAGLNHGPHRLEASLMYYDQKQDTDWGLPVLGNEQRGIKTTAAFGQVDPRVVPQYTQNRVMQVSYLNRDFLDGTARLQAFHENNEQLFAWNATRSSQAYIQSLKDGLRADFNTPLSHFGLGEGRILWGAEYIRDRTGQWVNTNPAQVWVPRIDQKDYAGFVQVEASPLSGLTLQAGARYDKFDVTVPGFKVLTSNLRVTGGDLSYDDLVFNAGASQELNRAATVYAGFSQGFSLPDIGLALRATTVANPLVSLRPQPVKVNNYEVGVRGQVFDARYTLATFLSTSKLGQSFVPDPTDPLVRMVVRAAERIWGVEATLNGAWMDGRGAWGGTFSWVDGRVDSNGDGKVDAPFTNDRVGPIKVTGYVSMEVMPEWPVRLQGLYSGDRNAFPAIAGTSVGNNGHIHSYAVFDLLTSHKVGPGEVSLALTNIFNNRYFNVAAQLSGNRPDRYVLSPGAGFRLSYVANY